MREIVSIREMTETSAEVRRSGLAIGFVPTMGFLHEGHLSLVQEARRRSDWVVASIFVNRPQFNDPRDFEGYPQDLDRDRRLLAEAGTDVLFTPRAEEMYPPGYQTYVNVEEVTRTLCGAGRPGHFRGVTTVVAKLFNILRPDLAIFGEKDFQQLVTIRRMVEDLNMGIEILGMPTFREPDGLAMSSRNARLKPEERLSALALSQALRLAVQRVEAGTRDARAIAREVEEKIGRAAFTSVEYVKVCDPVSLAEVDWIDPEGRGKPALIALAVHVGATRLIDNCMLWPSGQAPARPRGGPSNA